MSDQIERLPLDPYPYVWDGHTPFNQMRTDTDMFRKGAPRSLDNYPFRPRPGYSQNQEDYS